MRCPQRPCGARSGVSACFTILWGEVKTRGRAVNAGKGCRSPIASPRSLPGAVHQGSAAQPSGKVRCVAVCAAARVLACLARCWHATALPPAVTPPARARRGLQHSASSLHPCCSFYHAGAPTPIPFPAPSPAPAANASQPGEPGGCRTRRRTRCWPSWRRRWRRTASSGRTSSRGSRCDGGVFGGFLAHWKHRSCMRAGLNSV